MMAKFILPIYLFCIIAVFVATPLAIHGIAADKEHLQKLKKNLPGYHFMKHFPEDTDVIYRDGVPHIVKESFPFNTLSKYYIYGVGAVPRGSDMSKVLDKYYDSLLLNDTRNKW